jgi:hypothetical protein
MKKAVFLFSFVLILGLIFVSCKKDSSQTSTLNVRMTDAPGPFGAVNVDIQSVEVTGTNNNAVLLNVHSGIYNLLDLANGKDTLLGTGALNVGSVEQIRLILGSNNSVVVNNVSYPLSTPSAEQSGLKLQVHQTLESGVTYRILLDFDANQSIVETGNNTFKLKPVIRTIDMAVTGSIRGVISPVGLTATVTATSGTSSYSSVVGTNGNFLISGVPAGTYTVVVTPALPKLPVTIANVSVTTGISANVGTIAIP